MNEEQPENTMNANTNIATLGTSPINLAAGFERTLHAAAEAARPLKTGALLAAAPFIGLAFVVTAPFIGLAALAWLAVKAFAARWKTAARTARNVALFFAAPFIGLAYALAFPFVGVGVLVWTAVRRVNEPAARC